ncbi:MULTISPECIES: antibiotic biosynthesis monooxygenase [unclassified Pseudomonas]|uniref:antibiotic biosynthesis monooxygenase family protein n=1 Tax=unclassified Pseudomonas TaxID=196821 RepID=UPI002458ED8B|nr:MULTISPECIES: antibiotic biosynthesis monooxygenase [unclassified Pseudomonas]MDH4564723.1 antibiotic biosynthesis monooxygenase [Pseudomonas sp. BN411]MDH4874268.1 antibiotic biosynthesis monooxygenase [Pseudomonas sp. BN515]
MIARTPEPPYYAVIFTSLRSDTEQDYAATAERMLELAREQPGFLGVESARGADGLGITVSYWRDEESIRTWRVQAEHREAQRRGRAEWYRAFRTRVAYVERDYGLE